MRINKRIQNKKLSVTGVKLGRDFKIGHFFGIHTLCFGAQPLRELERHAGET